MNSNWPLVSLDELIRLERRPVEVKPEQQYQEIGIYCFGRGIFHKTPRTGLEVGDKNLYELREGDLILQVTFAWEGAIALCSTAESGLFGSTRYPTFRVDEARCYAPFLVRYLGTRDGLDQINKICPGSAGRNRVLSLKRIHEVMVPLPPLSEQRRIVARIEELAAKINEARGLRNQAVQETERLYAATLSQRTQPNGKEWIRETVGDVIVSMDAGWSPQCDDIPARDGEWGVLKTTSVQWCEFRPYENKALPPTLDPSPGLAIEEGDVLVTRAGPRKRVGVVASVRKSDPRLTISDKLIRLRPDLEKIEPRFLEISVASPYSQEYLVHRKTGLADAQVNISQSILRATPIAYPSLFEQRRIVAELDALQAEVDALKKLQTETTAELNALLPAILDKAFKG
jgi:type I restriction enzyme S subunit